jgi:hypothetical protein
MITKTPMLVYGMRVSLSPYLTKLVPSRRPRSKKSRIIRKWAKRFPSKTVVDTSIYAMTVDGQQHVVMHPGVWSVIQAGLENDVENRELRKLREVVYRGVDNSAQEYKAVPT